MDNRLAEGLDRTLSLAGNAQLKRVGDEVTHDAQVRKHAEEVSRETTSTTEEREPGYGHGV